MTPDQIASADIMTDEFGSPALYTALATGEPVALFAVMTYGAEVVVGEVYERRDLAFIQSSDITEPVRGDALLVDSVDSYIVDSYSRSGALWQLMLVKQ